MSQFRRNPITGHWVIVAENRGARPQEISLQPVVRDTDDCPFCEGRESLTPGEVLARREKGSRPDGPSWRVRVVPNKYPALDGALECADPGPACTGDEVPGAAGVGVHEVVIESPRHLTTVTQLSDDEFAEVLDVYRQRLEQLGEAFPGGQAVVFKNNGPAAGATLVHLHSQLFMAAAGSAGVLAVRAGNFRRIGEQGGECPACQMVHQEAAASNGIVTETDHYVALCPFASRLPYETWILPRRHQPHYSRINRESLPELASLFRGVLVKLERTLKVPAYNYIIHTAPFDTSGADHYHWHIEILPRITTLAGFELGAGCYINPVSPERAAAELRKA